MTITSTAEVWMYILLNSEIFKRRPSVKSSMFMVEDLNFLPRLQRFVLPPSTGKFIPLM